jgi:uncharacterized protein Veg
MTNRDTLIQIRRNIENSVGKKVQLRTNKGRKKSNVSEGVLDSAYPGVFIIRIDDGLLTERKLSYSYSDVLTETVELTFSSAFM